MAISKAKKKSDAMDALMSHTKDNVSAAAELSGLHRATVYDKLARVEDQRLAVNSADTDAADASPELLEARDAIYGVNRLGNSPIELRKTLVGLQGRVRRAKDELESTESIVKYLLRSV